MANFLLPLDKVATFTITEMNPTTSTFDPVPAGDVFTIVSADTVNLQAVVGTNATGGPAVVANWLHTTTPLLTGIAVTITDSAGNLAFTQLFDMGASPDQIGLDVADVVLTSQPTPV